MTTSAAAPFLLTAQDSARSASVDPATALGTVVGVALMVFGGQVVRRPSSRAKVAGVVLIASGVLFALGGLSWLVGVAGS